MPDAYNTSIQMDRLGIVLQSRDAASKSRCRIPSLDGLRAISIFLVLGGHLQYSGTVPRALLPFMPLFVGELGVRIFFVISGFLISSLLVREQYATGKVSLRNFYVRRFVRLAPVQLAFVLTLFILTIATRLSMSGCQFLTALTYTKNYACAAWIDGHLWSLSVEEQFYLLWPVILVRAPRRFALFAAIALIAISPVSRALEYHLGARQFLWLTSNIDALMLGCLLAIASSALLLAISRWHPAPLRAACLGIIVGQEVLKQKLLLGWFTVTIGPLIQSVAIAYLIVSFTHYRDDLVYRALNWRPLAFIGILSYSLYVWQQILFSRPDAFGLPSRPLLLTFPINLLLCFAVAIISYRYIEQPLMAVRSRFRNMPR
jgi:peptidoglycan/LPS O-acetylase OafA/YrhL